jgi:hypothetical protein
MQRKDYLPPEIEIVEFAVEKGFASSNPGDLENPSFGGSF